MWYIGQKKSLWLQIKENAGQYCDVPPNSIFILTIDKKYNLANGTSGNIINGRTYKDKQVIIKRILTS